jgi:hypothetical protein
VSFVVIRQFQVSNSSASFFAECRRIVPRSSGVRKDLPLISYGFPAFFWLYSQKSMGWKNREKATANPCTPVRFRARPPIHLDILVRGRRPLADREKGKRE